MTSSLADPIRLGSLLLPNRVFYSPLAGCSDFPFRQMSARFSPGLIYCEMVKMDALVRNDPTTLHILDYNSDMHPIGGQIVGAKRHLAGQAAKIIEDLGFDVLDLNCGCPVDKVTKDGGGSGLLKNPEQIGDIIAEMVAAVKIPVTVKIRAGWDEKNICAGEITRIAEEAGAKAIAIHGRTRVQAYRGPANWDYIREAKEAARNILVIGNGDVFSAEAAHAMKEQTGCDIVLASRGTLGHPYLAEDVCRYAKGLPVLERTIDESIELLKQHFALSRMYYRPKKAVTDMRRIACWYLKKSAANKDFRKAFSKASSLSEVEELLGDLSQLCACAA
ncbi:MAG: tRNA dihydrouridine synthase DusB [Waddliaceae bacterium]|nr:tRNA dihydrouridine synthase DusB [Waddliaceae bacterium]